MDIKSCKNTFMPYALNIIVIDNFYENDELALIKKELYELIPHLKTSDKVPSAYKVNKETGKIKYKKNCLSLWVDDFYKNDINKSNILKLNKKIFSSEVSEFAKNVHSIYSYINESQSRQTLLNYYKNAEHYGAHRDISIISVISFFELGMVKSGGLIFPQDQLKVNFKDNRTIIFPSSMLHETESIKVNDNSYRVSMAQFLGRKQ